MRKINPGIFIILFLFFARTGLGQSDQLAREAKEAMLRATRYMVETVSTNGGYVWNYLPDFSRRWGEMEAYPTMIWLQHPGTVSMGHLFLDAYSATGNEYYYEAARKAAAAIIRGQNHEGGWNYMIDFAGDRSLKQWYQTIGKYGWRLEEFQHYYGNSTFDDDVSSDAARFLLRFYLEKLDPAYKPALDKAINFILESQYPIGGWPQRYPLKHDFSNLGRPDYSSFHTFNDDVIWENIHFLIQCYLMLGQERFLEPIHRGMNFYLLSQDGNGAWGQQVDLSLKAAGARSYEPDAFLPGVTYGNAMLLLRFYQYTGDKKFLNHVPPAIKWLEETKLPDAKTENGRYSHPTFVALDTNQPIYVHRKGSNVVNGYYYTDDNDQNLLVHYRGKTRVSVERLQEEYNRLSLLPQGELTKDSPFRLQQCQPNDPRNEYNLSRFKPFGKPDAQEVNAVIQALDDQDRWLDRHVMISHPYLGKKITQNLNDLTDQYASTNVGDEYDTSPFRDTTEQEYISTNMYIKNMLTLIRFINMVTESTKD